MTLNIRELLLGHPIRLRYVKRWGTSRVMQPDTVAEHSYFCALYSLLIAKWIEYEHKDEYEIRLGMLLTRALVHDLEEAISGDFPRPFKHSSPELKDLLDRAGQIAFGQVVAGLYDDGPFDPPNSPSPAVQAVSDLAHAWKRGKAEDYEGAILDFADFLCALSFMLQEKSTWNSTTSQYTATMKDYFGSFLHERFNFLRPLVQQAGKVMNELFPKANGSVRT